jgi:two-component system LytT family sensor kinase
MQVLYGELATVEINSRPGRGTKVTMVMPILDADAETWGPIGGAAGQAISHMVGDAVRAMTRS